MKNRIIAVDFDGTLCENEYPEIGIPHMDVIEYIKRRKAEGDKLILWTNRVNDKLDAAVQWSLEQGIIFDAVNDNLPEIVEAFGTNSRKIFANEYIDDCNMLVSSCHEKSNMEKWAEEEVRIACESEAPNRRMGEWDYGCACYVSALKAFKSLLEDEHSGMSIGFTKVILNRLIDCKPLKPIEDTEDVWNEVRGFNDGGKHFQCKRMSSLSKNVSIDGIVTYSDVDRYVKKDINTDTTWHSGLIDDIGEEMFPITMPYFPCPEPFMFFCEEFLLDPKNGDFDTVGIFYVIKPDGERVEINRYFKDSEKGYDEIDRGEYLARKESVGAKMEVGNE